MAHAAKQSQLADGLITSIVGTPVGRAEAKQLHDRTLKGLKNTTHARTNQFDVRSKLDGLVEKFAVLNRDDLSEGLQSRLQELPEKSKWLPEVLSLLLELSDRPLEKTRFEDVEAASRIDEEQPALTLADIIADDPPDEAGIWDDVERCYHSSDDDFTDEDVSGDETQATSVTEDDPVTLARMHVVQVDEEVLDQVQSARQSSDAALSGQALSELLLIRETLCMLHGLPTNIYDLDDRTGNVTLAGDVKLTASSQGILQHILRGLADIGSSLNALRSWVKREQAAPTLRSCQAAVSSEMTRLASQLAAIEQRYLTPGEKGVASLIDVRTDVENLTQPCLALTRLVQDYRVETLDSSVTLLDRLYDETCIAQLSGDSGASSVLTSVLSAGLNTYLRPVSQWINAGKCDSNDDDFFVTEAKSHCELGRLWHDRYALRQAKKGEAAAPTFLQPFAARIFALGKGRAFLKALAREEDEGGSEPAHPSLDLHEAQSDLLPFSQVLVDALEGWIAEQSRDQRPLLRRAILHEHGLLNTVDILQDIFSSRNGRRFQTFADTLFWRIDNSARWRDGFLLTELAQSTLGSAEGVFAENIAIQVAESADEATESSTRSLRDLTLHYHLPWPLQNVTASASSLPYSRVFTILLQTYRAKYLLRQQIFTLRHLSSQSQAQPVPFPLSPVLQTALRLHQRLSTLVDILHAHITHTSALLSAALKRELSEAGDIDAMARIWQRHEQVLEVSLLVAEKLGPVREAILAVLGLCERVERAVERLGGAEVEETVVDDQEGDGGVDVHALHKELDSSLSFITAGLRGIGRAGGNAALEQLAERLEWAVH